MKIPAGPEAALARLDIKLAELDAKLREVNGTLKDIRAERRAVEDLIARHSPDEVDAQFEAAVTEGLKDFSVSLDTAIKGATQAVYNRFDVIAGICLGEDAVSQRDGKEPLEVLIRQYVRARGGRVEFPGTVTG
jgi:hypothetical protein